MDNQRGSKRKRQLPEFKDLFKALFKIPDHDIQDRVLAAINGIIKDTCDCQCCKKDVSDVATQTDWISHISVKSDIFKPNCMDNKICSPINSDSNSGTESKRRKRTRRVPHVEKSSNEVSPFLARPINMSARKETTPPQQPRIQVLEDTLDWLKDYSDFDVISEPPEPINDKCDLIDLMKKEWMCSLQFVNGLLPLHKAICENNFKHLKRQLYVLRQRKLNINKLLSQDHESPLQLALKNNCTTRILEELLKNCSDIDELDASGNTLLHLAILDTENQNILKILLKRVDLDYLLLKNHDGLTCLHIGVKYNKFFMCKCILEHIDEQLGIITVGRNITNEQVLMEHYMKELNSFNTKDPVLLNKRKMQIINQPDIKNRWTPLFYTVTMQSKLMMFMFLCHLADPTISEYSGFDCSSYAENTENFSSQVKHALRNTMLYLQKSGNC